MQFTILVYETQSELAARTDPKRKGAYWGAYEGLLRCAPTLGARVAAAAALAEARGAEAGLGALGTLAPAAVAAYQPYWALRAQLLKKLGRAEQASDAYDRAIGLSEEAAVREFLMARSDETR